MVIWLIVLLVPNWRQKAVQQASSYFFKDEASEHAIVYRTLDVEEVTMKMLLGVSPQIAPLSGLSTGDEVSQLIELEQTDPRDQGETLSVKYTPQLRRQSEAWLSGYAALARRYPNSALVYSQWVLAAASGPLPVDHPEQLAAWKVPELEGAPWISATGQQAALSAAQRGAELQPDNAFWPWMQAAFNFSLRRDEAALLCIEKAARCTNFDDSVATMAQNRMTVLKSARGLNFETELVEYWNQRFTHFARIRAACRAALWQSELAQKRGDTAKVLKIAAAMQEAGVSLTSNRQWVLTRVFGEVPCYIAWRGTAKNAGMKLPVIDYSTPQKRDEGRLAMAETFATYARNHGRADLAARALNLQASLKGSDLLDALQNPEVNELNRAAQILARCQWLGGWMLRLAFIGAVVWALSLLAMSRSAFSAAGARGTGLTLAAFCMGAMAAVFYVAVKLGAVGDAVFAAPRRGDVLPPPPGFDFGASLPFILVALWLVPAVLMTLFTQLSVRHLKKRDSGPGSSPPLPAVLYAALAFEFGALLIAWNTAGGRYFFLPLFSVFTASVLVIGIAEMVRSQRRERWSTLILWCAPLSVLGGTALLAGIIQAQSDLLASVLLILPLPVLLMMALIRRCSASSVRETVDALIGDFTARLNVAGATLALGCSVLYLGLLLWALPVQHHGAQVLDEQLRYGEVAYLKKRMGGAG